MVARGWRGGARGWEGVVEGKGERGERGREGRGKRGEGGEGSVGEWLRRAPLPFPSPQTGEGVLLNTFIRFANT